MNDKPPHCANTGLFITGTDTDVGKTYVAALIVRALRATGKRVGVYKPAASGCRRDPASGALVSDDAVALWEAAGRPGELERVSPQRFAAPLAPHLAARAEGHELDARMLREGLDYWRTQSEVIVVEGAGGLFSPLGDEELNIHLACDFGFPLVIVAANRLGTIHAVLATVKAAQANSPALPIAAIVLNDVTPNDGDLSRATNAAELRKHLNEVPVIELRHGATELSLSGFGPLAPRSGERDRVRG
jgi:dethiobiotin synthetase